MILRATIATNIAIAAVKYDFNTSQILFRNLKDVLSSLIWIK
jgi:hypothetical protein